MVFEELNFNTRTSTPDGGAPSDMGLSDSASEVKLELAGLVEKYKEGVLDILRNGFDFSCFNSTFTPAKVKANIQSIYAPIWEQIFIAIAMADTESAHEAAINQMVKCYEISRKYFDEILPVKRNWRSCSKKSIPLFGKFLDQFTPQYERVIESVEKNYSYTKETRQSSEVYKLPYGGQADIYSMEERVPYTVYTLKSRIIPVNADGSNPDSVDNNEPVSVQKKAGGWLLGVLVIGFLLNRKKKK